MTDPAPPSDTINASQIIGFLRKFADIMSLGENAKNLRDAAALLEQLSSSLDQTSQSLRDSEAQNAASRDLCDVAQAEVDSLKSEISALKDQMAAEQHQSKAALDTAEEKIREQSARAERAEALLAEASSNLQELQAGLAEIGQSRVIVPLPILGAIRSQFEFLAGQFKKVDDTASQVMCEIGSCTIDQAVTASLGSDAFGLITSTHDTISTGQDRPPDLIRQVS